MGVDQAKSQFEEVAREVEAYWKKTFGPSHSIEVELDMDSFSKAENMESALEWFMTANGYYWSSPLKNAMYYLSAWEDDKIVDAVSEGVSKITFALEPGTDTDKKTVEFSKKGDHITFKNVLEGRSWAGIFESYHEFYSAFMAAGLKSKPEYKVYLLSSVAQSYRVRYWGWLNEVRELIETDGLFSKKNEELKKDVEARCDGLADKDRVTAVFSNLLKINEHGRKQKRACAIGSSKWYTMDLADGGNKASSSNFKGYNYEDIVCIDIYPLSKVAIGEKKIGVTWYTTEKIEDTSMFGKMFSGFKGKLPGVKLPGVKLPGVKLPGIPMPSMNLPKVSLPSVNLPSVDLPKVSLPDLPEVDISNPFKRHKEPKPKRFHPCNTKKGGITKYFSWIADGLSTKEGNLLVEELAWVFYAGYSAKTRRSDYTPFYLKEASRPQFETGTEIDDNRAELTKE